MGELAIGSVADPKATSPDVDSTVVALLKGILNALAGGLTITVPGELSLEEPISVDDNNGSLTVDDGGLALSVDDGGSSLTVDGAVTIQEPLSVDDNEGSLTVDDGGGSLTVDGAVTIQEPLSVDDNGGSLTVDDGGATISVDDGGATISVDDGGGSLTVDGPLTDDQLRAAKVKIQVYPSPDEGLSLYRNLDLGSTGQVVKASAGLVYGYYFYNNASAAARYVKLYDKASAPTSSDTPVATIPLPAGSAAHLALPYGLGFASGISLRAVTGVADNDTGAPSSNDVVVNVWYK